MAVALCSSVIIMDGSSSVPNITTHFNHLKTSLSSSIKGMPVVVGRVSKALKSTSARVLGTLVDSMFQFVDQPILPSQGNFVPVKEFGEVVEVNCIEGEIPKNFPEGVYIRNGPNPLYGGPKSTSSIFGTATNTWLEGEGMLHALYFKKNLKGEFVVSYNNRYIESDIFKIEKQRGKPSFFPAIEGDAPAILAAFILNELRFGSPDKSLNNTNIFEHSGKLYSISENYIPQEINRNTLETCDTWDVKGDWTRPFTSHPKKARGTGDLVIMGIGAKKPYFVVGVISADGNLVHKADLKFDKSVFTHEMGITQQYNVILHHSVTLDINRLYKGYSLFTYDKQAQAKIGVMPRYGEADSIKWFNVNSNCTFHILNTFEDGDEVVVRGCRALESILPGPELGKNRLEWFQKGFKSMKQNRDGSIEEGYLFHRLYEWRLNMITGEVTEKNLTRSDISMDFPLVNGDYVGLKHKFGYTQVVDTVASSICGMAKYGGVAKLYFDDANTKIDGEEADEFVKIEYHKFPENTFCTGTAFVHRTGEKGEDDGWLICYLHNESTNASQVYIVDAKNLGSLPVAKITLPQRVPYGFHGLYISTPKTS